MRRDRRHRRSAEQVAVAHQPLDAAPVAGVRHPQDLAHVQVPLQGEDLHPVDELGRLGVAEIDRRRP
nr:hypothetical protein [Arsenicicoccus piscis]